MELSKQGCEGDSGSPCLLPPGEEGERLQFGGREFMCFRTFHTNEEFCPGLMAPSGGLTFALQGSSGHFKQVQFHMFCCLWSVLLCSLKSKFV